MAPVNVIMPSYLFLLPPLPLPVSRESLTAVYETPMTDVLKKVSYESRTGTVGASLDIALSVALFAEKKDQPRTALYNVVQHLVAEVYRLICVIAAKTRINIEDSEGIDARIILLAHETSHGNSDTTSVQAVLGNLIGPVINLQTLARCERPWRHVFSIDNAEGEGVLRQFLVCQDHRVKIHQVKAGTVAIPENNQESMNAVQILQHGRHNSIAVGGTWDHIHIGHKLLLTMFAFVLASELENGGIERSLTIGVTGDELLVNKKYAEVLECWADRQRSVSDFLRAIMDFRPPANAEVSTREISEPIPNGHAVHVALGSSVILKCVEINDPYGPTITDETITALVLSAETRSGGKAVNDKRKEKGWSELEIFEVDVLDAEGDDKESKMQKTDDAFQSKLSSTSIRKAIIEKGRIRSKA